MRFASHYPTTFELQFCLLLHCFFFHHSRYQVDDTRHVLTKTTKHTFSAVTIPYATSLAEYVSVVTVAFGTEYYVLGIVLLFISHYTKWVAYSGRDERFVLKLLCYYGFVFGVCCFCYSDTTLVRGCPRRTPWTCR